MIDIDRLASRLPEKPGIQFKEDLFNTVIMVLLVKVEGEYHFVFQNRVPEIRQGGEVCFPGGVYDPKSDSGFKDTALRETWEEMGIPADKMNVIGRLDTMVAPLGATVDAVVGVADVESLDEITINTKEVASFFTIPVSFFEQNEPEIYHVVIQSCPSYIDRKTGKEVVLLPAEELGLPEIYWKPWAGRKRNVYLYRTEQGMIWGITACFIKDFIGFL